MDDVVMTLVEQHLLLAVPEGGLVIHTACGNGALAAEICRRRPDLRLLGYDRSPAHIRSARERALPRATFAVFDLTLDRPPPAAGRVDAVVTSQVFRILKEPARLFLQFRRLMQPGAPLLVLETEAEGLQSRRQFLEAWGFRVAGSSGANLVAISPTPPPGVIRGWG
ncbi:MAG: class I SAM-dependent methyltransferase [Myxococcota bacterium]